MFMTIRTQPKKKKRGLFKDFMMNTLSGLRDNNNDNVGASSSTGGAYSRQRSVGDILDYRGKLYR